MPQFSYHMLRCCGLGRHSWHVNQARPGSPVVLQLLCSTTTTAGVLPQWSHCSIFGPLLWVMKSSSLQMLSAPFCTFQSCCCRHRGAFISRLWLRKPCKISRQSLAFYSPVIVHTLKICSQFARVLAVEVLEPATDTQAFTFMTLRAASSSCSGKLTRR